MFGLEILETRKFLKNILKIDKYANKQNSRQSVKKINIHNL